MAMISCQLTEHSDWMRRKDKVAASGIYALRKLEAKMLDEQEGIIT